MYVARDKDGSLYLFNARPVKIDECGDWQPSETSLDWIKLDPSRFPEVKWEDEEPTEVELVIIKRKQRTMCLKDKTKVCNLCHECDVDVLNPSY